jgi:hypothetical protein
MECERLVRLIKDWYLRVKQETMAPARMMQFVDNHVKDCEICQAELGLAEEIEKIREFVVPESKIPKAIRVQDDKPTPEISPDEEEAAEDKYIDDDDEDDDDEDSEDTEIDDESLL